MFYLKHPKGYIENIYTDSVQYTLYPESALNFENKKDAEKYAKEINAEVVEFEF